MLIHGRKKRMSRKLPGIFSKRHYFQFLSLFSVMKLLHNHCNIFVEVSISLVTLFCQTWNFETTAFLLKSECLKMRPTANSTATCYLPPAGPREFHWHRKSGCWGMETLIWAHQHPQQMGRQFVHLLPQRFSADLVLPSKKLSHCGTCARTKFYSTALLTLAESYIACIQDILSLCHKADASMANSEQILHVLKSITEDAFQLLFFKDCMTIDALVKECWRFEDVKNIGSHPTSSGPLMPWLLPHVMKLQAHWNR